MPKVINGPEKNNGNPRAFSEEFANPYVIDESFQLSGKLIAGADLKLLPHIEDLDKSLKSNDLKTFRKSFDRITSGITNERHRRRILYRIVYNHHYLLKVTPAEYQEDAEIINDIFNVDPLSRTTHSQLSVVVGHSSQPLSAESKKLFVDVYGKDVVKTTHAIRSARRELDSGDQVLDLSSAQLIREMDRFKTTNLGYIHLDEKKGITTILYLCETHEENGAFRYVVGSEDAKYSVTLKALHEYVYQDLNIRDSEKMASLPPEFRAGINYYHWLESEKQKVIDDYVYHVTGPAGRIIVFAGNAILHGGGLPVRGMRTALFTQYTGKYLHRARTLLDRRYLLGLANR